MNQNQRRNWGVKSFKLFELASEIFLTYRSEFDDMIQNEFPKGHEIPKSEDDLFGEDLEEILIYNDQVTKISGSCPYKPHDSVSDARVALLCVLKAVLMIKERDGRSLSSIFPHPLTTRNKNNQSKKSSKSGKRQGRRNNKKKAKNVNIVKEEKKSHASSQSKPSKASNSSGKKRKNNKRRKQKEKKNSQSKK